MKKRIRQGDPQKQRYWEEVVRRWREAGQSVRAFCGAEGLRESAFYFWRRELVRRGQRGPRRASAAANGSRTRARSAIPALRSPQRGPAPSFLPVHVVTPPSGCPGEAATAHGVEIVLTQGRTIRVRAGFDRQTLVDVLAVLEARPC